MKKHTQTLPSQPIQTSIIFWILRIPQEVLYWVTLIAYPSNIPSSVAQQEAQLTKHTEFVC